MRQFNLKILQKHNPTTKTLRWFQMLPKKTYCVKYELGDLIKEQEFELALWLLTELLNKSQNVKFTSYVSKLVLPIYEKQCPGDDQPHKAISIADQYLLSPLCIIKKRANKRGYSGIPRTDYTELADYAAAACGYTARVVGAVGTAKAGVFARYAIDSAVKSQGFNGDEFKKKIIDYGVLLLTTNERIFRGKPSIANQK